MKHRTGRAALVSIICAVALVTQAMTLTVLASDAPGGAVIQYFKNPDENAKPMARMWFPDAAAGADEDDVIEKQILELADKGFGGVEVAMLADGVSYDNAGGKEYGWGTTNWAKLLVKVLKAAAKVPGGFQVDMTITAHWPPTLNTIDPNDEAANKELTYSVTKVTAAGIADGKLDLTLPARKTDGPAGGFGGRSAYDHFLFTDTFVSAAIAKVSEIKQVPVAAASGFPGMPGATQAEPAEPTEPETKPRIVFDFASLQPLDSVTAADEGGYAAGVPDKATADAYGWDYDAIVEFFGPESDGPWVSGNGKLDAELNRKRMADWQDQYSADLTNVSLDGLNDGEEIQPGDWVIISTFERGTGQSISGGRIMRNGVFVTNYFNEAGTKALTDFWEGMLASEPELLELMKANPGYIFEDSIEASSASSYWASTMLDDVADDYAYKGVLPIVAASKYISSGFMGTSVTEFFSFDNDGGLVSRIYEDYNDKLAELYVKYRVQGLADWTRDALGWGFRGQTYHLPGLEISRAAQVADVAEADNMAKGDGIRYQSGTVNITGRDFLTMEAITGPTIGYAGMDDVITELGQNYSDGVNRAILHGTPYAKTFNGYNSDWPGWLPFGPSSFGSDYTYRNAYWDDIPAETGYMSRVQAVLQNGAALIDLAALIDKEHTYDFESGNRFQNLLDAGYSYNLVSEATLAGANAVVEGGRLAPDGPAYKALIVDKVSILSLAGIWRLVDYANGGLPIVVFDSEISRVFGSRTEDDAAVQTKFTELKGLPTVKTASTEAEIKDALAELGVVSYARYDAARLETTLYADPEDGTAYYYMFNNAYPENSGMMGNNQGAYYKGEDKYVRDARITLAGEGVPYLLDPHSGDISPAAYTDNGDGTVTITLDWLAGGDSIIIAVTTDTQNFPASKPIPAKKAALDAVDLSGGLWDLTIHSYGPDEDSSDPSVSKITVVDFGEQPLGKWKDIPATAEQLARLGVSDMRYVSGAGYYTAAFDAPDSWSGAYLDVAYGIDQIGSITINGTAIPANNASDRVDLGGLVVPGENTITVKLTTSLYGRMFVENSGYANSEYGMGGGFMAPVDPESYYNGLLSAKLVPYTLE